MIFFYHLGLKITKECRRKKEKKIILRRKRVIFLLRNYSSKQNQQKILIVQFLHAHVIYFFAFNAICNI